MKLIFVICLGPPPSISGGIEGLCNYAGSFVQSESRVEKAVGEMS